MAPRLTWHRLWRIGVTLVLVELTLLGSGWLYQTLASAQDAQTFPPPGQLVDVGGYRLHLYCTGPTETSYPTVIFESGLGAFSSMWALVQPLLATRTRVCSYDRAGYGWSENSSGWSEASSPRTAQQMATELHTLLNNAGEAPPYVLVGHSLGSLLVRVYAADYPNDVVGLVLIDPRHEDFFERMPPMYLRVDQQNLRDAQLLKTITPFGVTRLAGALGQLDKLKNYLAPLPPETEAAVWARMAYRTEHWVTAVAERESSPAIYAEARATTLPAALPLLVITAQEGWLAWQPSNSALDTESQALWLKMQEEQSQLTTQGEWQLLAGGHYLFFDQPAALAAALESWFERLPGIP